MKHGENKNVQKSIRLTDSDYSFIMAQSGDGFNEKLDKLLYRYFWHGQKLEHEVAQLEQRKAILKEQINQEESLLSELQLLHEDVSRLLNHVKMLSRCHDVQ